MFQNLSQGAAVCVLYRTEPRVEDGRVVSISTHMPVYNPSQPMAILNGPVTDITVQVGNDTIPFVSLPANAVTANFPDKGLFIATDRTAVLRELEAMASVSRQAIEQEPVHRKMLESCEALLLRLQPEKQKEAHQAQEIESLKTQLTAISGKFDKLVEMLSVKVPGQ